MVVLVNRLTGTRTTVAPAREAEYLAAGFRRAEELPAAEGVQQPAASGAGQSHTAGTVQQKARDAAKGTTRKAAPIKRSATAGK